MTEEILKHIEVIHNGKSYVGIEISETPEVFDLLKRNQLLIPMIFFKAVEKEEGIIVMDFSNESVFRTLKNVSETLNQKFLHEYHQDLI